jgi:hypothetical protein
VVIIRKDFENGAISESILGELYANYNDINDTALFVRRAKKIFPNGNCGLATLYLREILAKGEVIQGSYAGEAHTYLLIDEQIIDITADQYGGPEVYVGPIISPWSRT